MTTYPSNGLPMTAVTETILEHDQLRVKLGETLQLTWDEANAAQASLERLKKSTNLKNVSKEELIELHIRQCEITKKLVQHIDSSLVMLLNA